TSMRRMPSRREARSSRSMTAAMRSASICRFTSRSFPLEARIALFLERAHALAIVLGQAGLALQVALEVELRVERVAGRGEQRPLDQAIALGGTAGQPRGERLRLGSELIVVHRLPDQAPVLGVVRG